MATALDAWQGTIDRANAQTARNTQQMGANVGILGALAEQAAKQRALQEQAQAQKDIASGNIPGLMQTNTGRGILKQLQELESQKQLGAYRGAQITDLQRRADESNTRERALAALTQHMTQPNNSGFQNSTGAPVQMFQNEAELAAAASQHEKTSPGVPFQGQVNNPNTTRALAAIADPSRAIPQILRQQEAPKPTPALTPYQEQTLELRRRELARRESGTGASEPLEAVMGTDGKPVLVPRSQAVNRTPATRNTNPPRALPASALRMQQEALDGIGTASSIGSDIASIEKQIDEGKLNLSLLQNVAGEVRNRIGVSDEQSRNFASFKATLEKMRNDSLRLNKGVQTEGDSVRAWNELVKNINDKDVVKQRLQEIQLINQRAAELRANDVNVIRENFGQPPLDISRYQNQPATVGANRGQIQRPSGSQNQSAEMTRVTSEAEYNALPSGTQYIGPDGQPRTKR